MKPFIKRSTDVLLRRIPPSGQLVNYYANTSRIIADIVRFAKEGLEKSETVIIVGQQEHLKLADESLRQQNYDIFSLKLRDQFVPLNCDSFLEKIVVNGLPDEGLFRYQVVSLAMRAMKWSRNIRIFSEMSATVWLRGLPETSARLESIWQKLVDTNTEFPGVKLVSETVSIEETTNIKSA